MVSALQQSFPCYTWNQIIFKLTNLTKHHLSVVIKILTIPVCYGTLQYPGTQSIITDHPIIAVKVMNPQYLRILKPTWCTYYSIYQELRAATYFEHYLLILRRRYTNGTWYTACVLWMLAAPRLKWNQFHSNPGADNWHNTLYVKCRCAAPPEDEQVMLETCRGP
jgi:hypothetical protein